MRLSAGLTGEDKKTMEEILKMFGKGRRRHDDNGRNQGGIAGRPLLLFAEGDVRRAKACVAKNAAVALAEKYGNAVRDAPREIVRHIRYVVCGEQYAGVRAAKVGLQ